jgi:hypothetical protein
MNAPPSLGLHRNAPQLPLWLGALAGALARSLTNLLYMFGTIAFGAVMQTCMYGIPEDASL